MKRLLQLWPSQIGNQCLVMLAAGTLFGWLAPGQTPWLKPLATVFLQASQIVVMPFLICELIVGFGRLRAGSLEVLARRGGLVLLGLWLAGSLVVVGLPLFLPPLVTSEFFHAGIFERTEPANLLTTYLPDNIFGALAADNFPAVVLFSCLLGILLQSIDERDHLLAPLAVIRQLFVRLNKLVVKLIPYGIFALIAINVASLNGDQFIRMQGFIALCAIAFVLLSVGAALCLLTLTPLSPGAIWRLIKGPLALTASSANLLIALPMLVSNLQEQLPKELALDSGRTVDGDEAGDELAPLVSLGYALPTLGQVASLLFIPFAGWYVDRSLEPGATARMLLSGIPASVSGIRAVMRQELLQLGLPIDLLQLVYINGEWLYRFEKVLSLEGLVVLAVLVYARAVGAWRFRPGRVLAGVALLLGLTSVLGWSTRSALAYALQGTYRNDERLLSLTSTDTGPAPRDMQGPQPPQPVSLKAIKARGVLRAGLRSDGLPWAYRNNKGQLVGFDIDLLRKLATDLEVGLQIQEAPMPQLERWLAQGRVDLVAGGIQGSPSRAIQNELSRSYLQVHLALVVPDDKLRALQPGSGVRRTSPIVLAVRDEELISPDIERRISRYLSQGGPPVRVVIETIPNKAAFFSSAGQQRFDGLLTSAESGASWAVVYPRTSLITPFINDLNSDLVLLIAGQDASLRRYVNGFLSREQAQGGIETLYNHWILLKD